MTNAEAIEVISQDIPCEYDMDLIEALEMAIEALSEPTIPLSVIDKIKAEINEKIAESMREAPCSEGEARYGFWKALEIIDQAIKECDT